MNYEKAYKEALERAKIWQEHLYEVGDKDYADELNYIFPELKESEDERIRKWLIDWAKAVNWSEQFTVTKEQVLAWLEKQGERTIVDKAESKFHEGDWVTDGKALLYITKFETDYGYELKAIDGEAFHFVSPDFVETNYYLWSIQDAKDGDVLTCGDDKRPFIFKGLLDPNHPNCPVAYCGIDSDGLFFVSIGDHWWTDENVCPATNAQRDILFQKMKEAGYEWDAEKKELKIIDWSKHIKYEPNGPSITEENTEWSEEDEKMLDSVETDYLQEFHENLKKLKVK